MKDFTEFLKRGCIKPLVEKKFRNSISYLENVFSGMIMKFQIRLFHSQLLLMENLQMFSLKLDNKVLQQVSGVPTGWNLAPFFQIFCK